MALECGSQGQCRSAGANRGNVLRLRDCRQPIFLKLLFEEVKLWHSYAPALAPSDSASLLAQLFDRLSHPTNHGPLLVNRVLGYLSASRHGLAENEILGNPVRRPRVQSKAQRSHRADPAGAAAPVPSKSRSRCGLGSGLTLPLTSPSGAAVGANVLTFYHRQVAGWVREHFAKSFRSKLATAPAVGGLLPLPF